MAIGESGFLREDVHSISIMIPGKMIGWRCCQIPGFSIDLGHRFVNP
jgi:hypothetical protein